MSRVPLPRRRLLAAAVLAPPAARAQGRWPERPIVLVVPFTPGGSTDIAARILAERMAPRLGPGARIVIENRAGAGGSLGAEFVRRAAPDGYTLLAATASSHATNPAALPQTTPYDPVADFTPVAVIGGGPLVVVVPGASPHASLTDLLAALRARPGAASWATSGAAGIGHLTGAWLLARAGGLVAEHVPYRGGAQVLEAMVKGEVEFSVEVLASAAPHIRDGTSRALAVSGAARHPLVPLVPTLIESGLSGFDVTTWNVLVGPRGLPAPILGTLNAAAVAALAEPPLRERFATAGVDAAGPTTPAATGAFLAAELAKFRTIVAEAGLRLGG
jgi:tripartite-type tricarboxylate transporter receptor subunit TctC